MYCIKLEYIHFINVIVVNVCCWSSIDVLCMIESMFRKPQSEVKTMSTIVKQKHDDLTFLLVNHERRSQTHKHSYQSQSQFQQQTTLATDTHHKNKQKIYMSIKDFYRKLMSELIIGFIFTFIIRFNIGIIGLFDYCLSRFNLQRCFDE